MGWQGERGERLDPVVRNILQSPLVDEILSKIPIGSKYLGIGTSTIVLETPEGEVLRIGRGSSKRMKLDGLLQPLKPPEFVGNFIIELLPKVQLTGITDEDAVELEKRLNSQGYRLTDVVLGRWNNLGRLPNGEVVVFDPDAIEPL